MGKINVYIDHKVALQHLLRYIPTLLGKSWFYNYTPVQESSLLLKMRQHWHLLYEWMLVMFYPYHYVCMCVIIVYVGIVSNVSRTYVCMILSPAYARIFTVIHTWRNHLESNSVNKILILVVTPTPHNRKLPSHITMGCLTTRRPKHTHTVSFGSNYNCITTLHFFT